MEITFSEWLQAEIDKRGWTWNKLADIAGLSSGTIYNIRDGVRGVGESSLKAISSALHLPLETVYRASGFLPQSSDKDIGKEELNFLFDKLSSQEKEEILELLRFKTQRSKGETTTKSRSKRPARSVLKD